MNDIRAVNVTTGRLVRMFGTNDIRSTNVDAAGPIFQIIAGQNITSSRLFSGGPDGRIDLVQSRFFLTGEISSSGPIGTITSTEGDVVATITTTDSADGTVALLNAGRDLLITTDIASSIALVQAGRNVGTPFDGSTRVINVRGNLGTIQTPNGQIYTDVRVSGDITGAIRTGRVVAVPGFDVVSRASFVAFGRIAFADINGDLNGSIISESGGIGTVRITNGSFRQGNQILAHDAGIDLVQIIGGHLLGNIIADETIGAVQVLAGADGFWGDIGVNPNLSQFARFDNFRNQLPPGTVTSAGFNGAQIRSGTNVGVVLVERASMWESSIVGGHSVGQVIIAGVIMNDGQTTGVGSFIVASDSIGIVQVGGLARDVIIGAGIRSLGADGRPGGTGVNLDVAQFGRVGDVTIRGGSNNVNVVSGMNTGADGVYATMDDEVANGISSINSVRVEGGAVVGTSAFADNGIGFTTAGIVRGGPGLNQAEPNKVIEFVPSGGQVPAGGLAFTTLAGETGFIRLTGPGQAYFEHVLDEESGQMVNRLALINTTLASTLVVSANQNRLTDFKIVSNDGSSIGSASIRGNLEGRSSFYFDGYVQFVEFGALNTTGSIGAGNDIGTLIVGPTTRGTIDANFINSIIIGGNFGTPGQTGEANIRLLAGNSILIGGAHSGMIYSQRDLGVVNIIGAINRGSVNAGRSIIEVRGASMSESRISAGNNITNVVINGEVFDSSIYAGTDLGTDGTFGGTGTAADRTSNGSITSVFVNGSFRESDVAAGVARGPDGFLGTPDDVVAEGHSSISRVDILGAQVGSILGSESYRIISNGTVGPVRVGNNFNFTQQGNFVKVGVAAAPDALRVTDLSVVEEGRVYTARLQFNQPVDSSTLSAALNVFEVRSAGAVSIRLSENIDYTVAYNPVTRTALVTFSRVVTDRSLPQVNGVPGPGVYRFTLESDTLRGQTQNARLDGNGDGVPVLNDDYSDDAVVGDAGDKLVQFSGVIGGTQIDFYDPIDLNLLLDRNDFSDGLPEINRTFTIRGTIGDHPDQNINDFGISSDVDLYRVTLRAGQILRLGAIQGLAQLAQLRLIDSQGNVLEGTGNLVQQLPANPQEIGNLSREQQFLIKQTGTYIIGISTDFDVADIADPQNVPNVPTIPGNTGPYSFSVRIFDDGDTGFAGDTDSGNGVSIVNAPIPIAFVGTDGQLNTPDDLATVTTGIFTFTLNPGADNIKGTADDVISGTTPFGLTSTRTAGGDGIFGNTDDRLVSTVSASIGESGSAGVPQTIAPDVDVYHLNNRQNLAAGTVVRALLQLSEFGSNLGLTGDPLVDGDLRGSVQFALFETTGATGVGDARLIAAPSDVAPVGGSPNQLTSDGKTFYGYDANGDFFMEFVIPATGQYAIYLQGALRSDYSLEIITQGTRSTARPIQNVLLETRGGTIDWLEAGNGLTTTLRSFTTSVLGFSGLVGAQPVDSFVLSSLVTTLNDIFAAANVDVRFSTNPTAFEGQEFSTVFLTASNEPTAFFNNGTFGVSEHSDPFNADHTDQAVVFLPSLALLGNQPTTAGINRLVEQLSVAVSRRVGELVGLRMTDPADAPATAIMAADSVTQGVGPFRFENQSVSLSAGFDDVVNTDFFLGEQNSFDLLDRILADRF